MSTGKDVHSPLLGANSKTATTSPTQPKPVASNSKPAVSSLTPVETGVRKADTNYSWGTPAGLKPRGPNDENLVIFRKALGINFHREHAADGATLEEGRQCATGIYRQVIEAQEKKHIQGNVLTAVLYLCYFAQIVIGAALTSLGPNAARHSTSITLLGAINTVLAGVLALIKASGQPQRFEKDQVGYRRLQDWIEETEALLAVGVIGRDRKEVGILVEVAFRKYNAAKADEENNRPDMYVNGPLESLGNGTSLDLDDSVRPSGKTGDAH